MKMLHCNSISLVLLALSCLRSLALPLQQELTSKQSECLYETLDKDERMTLSVFISQGSPLKVDALIEGPFATLDEDVSSFLPLMEGFQRQIYNQDVLMVKEVINFEKTEAETIPPPEIPSTEGDILTQYENAKRRRDKENLQFQDGEPFSITKKAPKEGWYRVCIVARYSPVKVEIELRKESELGGMEGDHVKTHELQQFEQENLSSLLPNLDALLEGISEQDFDSTRNKVVELRGKVAEIQAMMQRERRRVMLHKEVNEHSHGRMVKTSIIETLVFVLVTLYQVRLIRTWFTTGNPVLGR